ncbi:MAG: hypothetical protein P4M12_12305 [Gammaproteobacteria bacterium]|nr:hypothetical protein [Gammaproteobacteria bacterium]
MTIRSLEVLKENLRQILDSYDDGVNPARQANEGQLSYFFSRLSLTGGLRKGSAGRERSRLFREVLDNYEGTSEGFLNKLGDSVYESYSKTSVGSELCSKIFNMIAHELELVRAKQIMITGMHTHPLQVDEEDVTYFERIHSKTKSLMAPVQLHVM